MKRSLTTWSIALASWAAVWIVVPAAQAPATSGKTITSFARGGLSAAAGQVYVVTFDNTVYAFGIPMEH